MVINELFEKIVKLEEISDDITKESFLTSSKIKNQAKKELESLLIQLTNEKNSLLSQLEKERIEEETNLKNKYNKDLSVYTSQLNDTFQSNLHQIVTIFKEINKI
jgi:hypothetical protein